MYDGSKSVVISLITGELNELLLLELVFLKTIV